MKIAIKSILLASLLGVCAEVAQAQDLASASVAVAASAQATGAAIASMPSPAMPQRPSVGSGSAIEPVPPVASGPSATANAYEDKEDEDSDVDGIKVPSKVKSAISRLNLPSEKATVQDLNEAREAIAKLDMLIDIEKRINNLSEVRQKRQESSGIAPMPASAFAQPSVLAQPSAPIIQQPVVMAPPAPVVLPDADVVVVRIQGIPGRYVATIREGGSDKTKDVRVGDKFSDTSEIRAIDARGLTLLKDKKTRVIPIKDAGYIVSGTSSD